MEAAKSDKNDAKLATTRLLVALDGSDFSDQVLRFCAEHLTGRNEKVTFVHVYEYNTVPAVGPGAAMAGLNINEMNNELRKQAVSKGTKYLHQAAKKAKSLGFVPDEMKLLEGKPSMASAKHALLEYTKQTQPSMLICGSRGLGAMGRMFLGSTSDFLVHSCDCTVMIVKGAPGKNNSDAQNGSSGEKETLVT
mmetsp:Transcript_2781/g.5516  ORF Transcript_2781/g.5516 Transcript_2781/m.5516 type:complete len:193 (-) Transcript_2781:398-976(-)